MILSVYFSSVPTLMRGNGLRGHYIIFSNIITGQMTICSMAFIQYRKRVDTRHFIVIVHFLIRVLTHLFTES
ncbi:hypothetical protein D3C81_1692510 [compost metagenome]